MAKTSVKTPRFRHNVNDPLLIALSLFDVEPTAHIQCYFVSFAFQIYNDPFH